MRHFSYITRLSLSIYILLLVGCTFAISPTATQPSSTRPVEGSANAIHHHISDVALLGVITVPYTTIVQNTLVGGLSAIAYDKENGDYYFLSDDRGITGPPGDH